MPKTMTKNRAILKIGYERVQEDKRVHGKEKCLDGRAKARPQECVRDGGNDDDGNRASLDGDLCRRCAEHPIGEPGDAGTDESPNQRGKHHFHFDKFSFEDYDAVMLDQTSSQTPSRFIPLDRLSLLTSLVLVGLTLSLVLDLPAWRAEFSFLGSEASFTLSGMWLIALLLAALTAAGVNAIARMHPRVHLVETRYILTLWVLPMLVVVAATLLLSFADVRAYGVYALFLVVGAGVFFITVIVCEYITIDLEDRWYSAARLGLNLAAYLIGLILFATIYSLKIRSLYSAPAIGLAAGLLALELLRGSEADFARTWIYSAVIGLAIGEIVWALNYWNLSGFVGGAFLLIFFYAFAGLAQQYLWQRLNRIVLVEFAMIFIGAIVLLFWLRPR